MLIAGELRSAGAGILPSTIEDFRAAVLGHYAAEGRSFPWRETDDPWLVLVSEIMLQQTRTDRVIAYWLRWRELWPNPAALAAAPLEEVLREWSGLGYNRRARFLKEAAIAVTERMGGTLSGKVSELETLPGIGPYTARAVACFAFNEPIAFIETNIRAAAIHFFFPDRVEVKDSEILPFLEAALDRSDPRRWNWALMDYGAALKRLTVNPGRRSAHHVRQSPFQGSLRQARGAALRILSTTGPSCLRGLADETGLPEDRLVPALRSLVSDSMVAEAAGVYRINDLG